MCTSRGYTFKTLNINEYVCIHINKMRLQKRKNHHILQKVHTLLLKSNVPNHSGVKAAHTAVHLINIFYLKHLEIYHHLNVFLEFPMIIFSFSVYNLQISSIFRNEQNFISQLNVFSSGTVMNRRDYFVTLLFSDICMVLNMFFTEKFINFLACYRTRFTRSPPAVFNIQTCPDMLEERKCLLPRNFLILPT